jgi:hypothetical protein
MAWKKYARSVVAVAIATITVATLDASEDLLYCKFFLHVTPRELFQYIASALLGPAKAVSLGWPSASLGVILHIGVSFLVVLAYFFLSRKFEMFRTRPFVMGPVFGIAVYCLMHYLVLPLTAVPKVVHSSKDFELANQLFAHIFMIGIPAAFLVTRFGASPRTNATHAREKMVQAAIKAR